jgi:hypothetical protein
MDSLKTQGWEVRLSEYIDKVRNEPFKRGVHDCALFAGVCADIMTGQDFTSQFRKPYKTKEQAYEFLKQLGYEGLAAIPNKLIGPALPAPAYAQRGDGVLIEVEIDGVRQEALGIVDMTGRRAVTVGKDGLVYYKMEHWKMAWRI